ncbi:MAG: hypothetical protein KBC16_03055 [Candidatus Pacebacteria bacterium]|nr:hypothetical protein [Candidatus Paceibacterota bacterium]
MIKDIVVGDITAKSNKSDVIIGMNSELRDVTGIGLRFLRNAVPSKLLKLGTVISYDFDESRKIHMIICHHLRQGGWVGAEEHVRFGLDFLNHVSEGQDHSIVQIGTGRVGKRDGANPALIRTAIADSHLPVSLFVYEPREALEMVERVDVPPMSPFRAWSVGEGIVPLRTAA